MPILLNSDLEKPAVRRTRLVAFCLFLIFSVLLFYTARDLEQEYRLYRHGIFVEGTASRSAPCKGGYVVYYEFSYNGISCHGMSDANEAWLRSTKLPTVIRVHFLANHPNISRLPDVREPSLLWFNIFFGCFFLLTELVLGAVVIKECHEILNQRKAKLKRAQPWHLPTYPKAWH
jgi:hypothetical protein